MFTAIPYAIDLSKKLVPGLWEKEQLKEVLMQFHLPRDKLEKVMEEMLSDFNNGLSDNKENNKKSPIKMLPTYVRSTPNGNEKGEYFALDLGGTNFRVLLVSIENGKIDMNGKVYHIADSLMKSDASQLFGYIADCLAKFAVANNITSKLPTVGFTFSFPVNQTSLTSGYLLKWTKGFSASGVEGEDVAKLLNDEIAKRKDIAVDQVALVNDTTGTMVSCAFDDPDVRIGLILGTGTNACYMEKLDRIPKWDGDREEPKEVIVNTEWGAFGENGELDFVKSKFDEAVDRESLYPGQQIYEKMISGMYLGEIARQAILELIKEGVLFDSRVSDKLQKPGSFESRYLSDVASDDAKKVITILEELGYENPSLQSCQVVKDVCDAVSYRSARLAAAGLATIVKRIGYKKLTVAVDGSLFKKHPKFKGYMATTLRELVPDHTIKLMLSEDGSGRGAGLVAAVSSRLKSE